MPASICTCIALAPAAERARLPRQCSKTKQQPCIFIRQITIAKTPVIPAKAAIQGSRLPGALDPGLCRDDDQPFVAGSIVAESHARHSQFDSYQRLLRNPFRLFRIIEFCERASHANSEPRRHQIEHKACTCRCDRGGVAPPDHAVREHWFTVFPLCRLDPRPSSQEEKGGVSPIFPSIALRRAPDSGVHGLRV